MIGLKCIDFMHERKLLIVTLLAFFLSIFVANVSALTTHRSFDFDCDDGGVETMTGWTSFPISAYDADAGYGWDDTSGINCVKRLSGDALQKDLHYASVDKTFKVDLKNGKYTVRVYMGDMGGYAHDNMDVSAEGNLMLHNVSTAAGEVKELSFDVAVSDRQLSLRFHDNGGTDLNWVVNGIEIVQNEVVVTSPDGGETLNGGNVYFITWTTSATKKPVANTFLSYSIDSGDTWKRIAISPGNLGWFPWQVPKILSEKDDCKVKVTLKDRLGLVLGTDTSNESFTIAATCNAWQALCSGACVNLQTDSDNCGACGNACGPEGTCIGGLCVCGPEQTLCGNTCVDLVTDDQHCGACGNVCSNNHGTPSCSQGSCGITCDYAGGYWDCDGDIKNGCETDFLNDSNNCGVCGNPCQQNETCIAGVCTPSP